MLRDHIQKRKLLSESDSWMKKTAEFLQSSDKIIDINGEISHCCQHRLMRGAKEVRKKVLRKCLTIERKGKTRKDLVQKRILSHEEMSTCAIKSNLVPESKKDNLKDKDGILFFPDYKIGICSSMEFPDSCCLGRQKSNGYAPPHCLLRPEVYHELRKDKIFSFKRVLNHVTEFSCDLQFLDPLSLGGCVWKAKVFLIPFSKYCGLKNGFNFTCNIDDKKILQEYCIYQSPAMVRRQALKGYDLSIVLGENPQAGSDFFLLNCRWLRYQYV